MRNMYVKGWFELSPKIDCRKSFYGKAKVSYVYDDLGVCGIVLKSYDTNVCYISSDGSINKLWDGYSQTTMRHIHDFIYQFAGVNSGGKKEWDKMPLYEYYFIETVSC